MNFDEFAHLYNPSRPVVDNLEHMARLRLAWQTWARLMEPDPSGDYRPAMFVRTLATVDTIEPAPGLHKARFTFAETNDRGEQETINTDPLEDEWARHLYDKAREIPPGTRVWIIKRNQPDPSGQTPAGFRRCVWIEQA